MNYVSSRRRTSILSLFFLFLLTATKSLAQDLDTVTMSGFVRDEQGALIVGAEVQAKLLKTGAVRKVLTDISGRYKLIQLEAGLYSLRFSCQGFTTQDFPELATIAAQNFEKDVVLKIADLTTGLVVVTSTATPVVDSKRTVAGATLTVRELDALPLTNRSVLDLIFTLPAVAEEPLSTRNLAEDRNTLAAQTPEEAGTFSLSGAPAFSNNLTIDGLDNNDDRAARERVQPSVEAVEEVQVITNQFSAEYGRASGGRINLRTRSGSKELRARAFYFFRDEALNANTYRNNSLGLSRLPLQEHLGGFTLASPSGLSKSVVLFIAFETSKTLDSTLIDTLVPVEPNDRFSIPPPTSLEKRRLEDAKAPALAAEVAPFVAGVSTPLTNKTFSGRADVQFSDVHHASVVYLGGWLFNLRQFSGGNRLFDSLQGARRRSQSIAIADNYVASSRFVNQARLQFSKLAPSFVAVGDRQSPVVLITLNDPLIEGELERRTGSLVAGSSTSGSSDRRETRFQFQNIASLLAGTHSLRLGVDVHRVKSTFTDLSDASGTFTFASAGDFLANVPSRFRQNFQSVSRQANTYVGVFIQDEWQIVPQLLFSYGLRYETETILKDRNNFGPRIALAYNPLESGRLVFRLGAGIFYNRALLRTIDDFTLGKQQLFFDTNNLVDKATGKLMTAAQRRDFIAAHLRFPEPLTAGSDVVREFGVLNTNFSRRLDPGLVIPASYQSNFGVEFDFGSGYSLEANYTLNRGIHLWREMNINSPVLPAGYRDFSSFLASRDFPNFRSPAGIRPLHNTSTAGELVRFSFGEFNTAAVSRVVESGVPVSLINLRSLNSTTAIEVALAALNELRPDPSRAEVEQLVSVGNSFYRGLTFELRKQFVNSELLAMMFRAGYTYSRLIDDGVVNTSDALKVGDFRKERARSLQDRKHRFVLSGLFTLPRFLGALHLSPIWRVASGAPFNISLGGSDRNLDDVGNDRPNFNGDLRSLRWRAPGEGFDASVIDKFGLPVIGQSGNLPRNAGRGPGMFLFDLNVARYLQISERVKLRVLIEFDNVLNKTVFSFGSEFINFDALSAEATTEQRQKFLDTFLVATRTMRPRQVRVGLRIDF